jgi:diaminopimelate epimerase
VIEVPFYKFHGDENDFLLTWADRSHVPDLPETARRICARNTGIGADGWMLLWPDSDGLRTRLFNADGSEPELSGNGTRCAAAFAIWSGIVPGPEVVITTGAGPKRLSLKGRRSTQFVFEMNMGRPEYVEADIHAKLNLSGGEIDATLVNVGNPQCAVFVDTLPQDWRAIGAELESHCRFPNRSNVSFVRVLDRNTLDVAFFERGVGETRSSGTGSTGAAVAAILRKRVENPVKIHTPAGELEFRWEEDNVYLTGPAEYVGEGVFVLGD